MTGPLILADASNQLNITSENVALISCDPYTGNIQPSDVFATALDHHAVAIVLFSETAQSCHAADLGTYSSIYTFKSRNQSVDMLEVVRSLGGDSVNPGYASILTRDAASNTTNDGGSNNGNGQSNSNPLGPSPSTAVAMIILYSITGVITALFLIIIITGAVRAHRHPERYGPRNGNGIGRPRRTRARGIALAMLDSIPIVKVGNRQDEEPKPNDVELENGQHGQVEYVGDQTRSTENAQDDEPVEAAAVDGSAHEAQAEKAAQPATSDGANESGNESGIAAAVSTERPPSGAEEEHQGCSICTDDFEVGQDQRVLPCDHRFHPACIDPWLLNVSGTCPLCRIDLRPSDTESQEGDTDEYGNPVIPSGEALAPPLEGESHRSSVRRSFMLGLMGIARPERMTREERVRALRDYRQRRIAEESRENDSATHTTAPARTEAETSRRSRLRNALRIRNRRTGDQRQTTSEEPPIAAAEPRRPETARLPEETQEDRDHDDGGGGAAGATEPANVSNAEPSQSRN